MAQRPRNRQIQPHSRGKNGRMELQFRFNRRPLIHRPDKQRWRSAENDPGDEAK
jgi:hypothetical protein